MRNIENIKKAIEIGICYIKSTRDDTGVRCFGNHMGYGKFVDLTLEEYEIYQKVASLTKQEIYKRLEKLCSTS